MGVQTEVVVNAASQSGKIWEQKGQMYALIRQHFSARRERESCIQLTYSIQ